MGRLTYVGKPSRLALAVSQREKVRRDALLTVDKPSRLALAVSQRERVRRDALLT